MELSQVQRATTTCPVCRLECFAAAGRGFCPECFITFEHTITRSQLMQSFVEKFYMSKNSAYYHRLGCKYIKNISPENISVVFEPTGKPCRCAK